MTEGNGLRALIARLEALPPIPSHTCPVCWPGVPILPDLAAMHREWHARRDAWLLAHATLNRTGLPTDEQALDAARFALADFEVQHPGLT